jgi:hypothetical protein
VTVLEAKWLRRFCDPLQILPAHGDLDVLGEAPRVGIQLLCVQVGSQATDDPILKPGGRKDLLHNLCRIEQPFHTRLEERIYEHGHD